MYQGRYGILEPDSKRFPRGIRKSGGVGKVSRAFHAKRQNGPVYLDELDPDRGDMNTEIFPDCGIMCYLSMK